MCCHGFVVIIYLLTEPVTSWDVCDR